MQAEIHVHGYKSHMGIRHLENAAVYMHGIVLSSH